MGALGEDLLLLAVNPRSGRLQTVERIALAVRAVELIELSAAGRVDLVADRVVVDDPAPLGDPCLDEALTALRSWASGPTLDEWLPARPAEPGPGVVKLHLDALAAAHVVRLETTGEGVALHTRIVVVDEERRVRALARIDAVVRGAADVTPEDRGLAGVVHACGLDRYLYRGLRGRASRRRLDRLGAYSAVADRTRAAVEAADAAFAEAVCQALSAGIAKFGRELKRDMYHQQHIAAPNHHHDSSWGHHTGGHSGGGHSGGHGGHDGGGHHG
jgi:hypothetical protein